jgi:membrane fusion protein (multidrug efflux system)
MLRHIFDPMKHTALILGIGLILGSCGGKEPSGAPAGGGPAGPGAAATQKPLRVNGMVATPQEFDEQITVSGTVVANEAVEVRPEVSGRIVSIGFKEGQRVAKGQLLVKLYDADLRAQLEKTKRQVTLDEDKVKRLKQIRNVDGVSLEEYELAVATLEMHKAESEIINAQLSKTEIRAPFAGTIGLRRVSEGAVVSSSTLIAVLKDDARLKLEFSVPEKVATLVRVGSPVTFRVRGGDANAPLQAVVYAQEPELDPQTRTLKVRAHCSASAGLVPGMFADITVQLGRTRDALLVPTESIVSDIKGKKVFVIRSGTAQEVRVQTGTRTADHVRVLSGIAPGDTVVTTGMLVLKQGVPVTIERLSSAQTER